MGETAMGHGWGSLRRMQAGLLWRFRNHYREKYLKVSCGLIVFNRNTGEVMQTITWRDT
jgi:hypothetical protein